MASIRYRSRGKHKLWQFEIRDENGKTVVSQSGFSTKKKLNLWELLFYKKFYKEASLIKK